MDRPRHIEVGTLINQRYLVDGHLGAGGYGQVLAATDRSQATPVAIKILHQEATQHDPDAAPRLRQEAEILRAIDHPHIVRVLEVGTFEGAPFLVMEYIEGVDLDTLIKQEGKLSAARLLPLIRQLLSALDTAHHQSVLHRDLKPENILVTHIQGEEAIKLVDFGIAKATSPLNIDDPDDAVTLLQTRAGGFVGTPRYTAPEMLVGDPVGPPTDLFCLGLVVFEALTGQPLIQGKTYQEAMSQLFIPTPFSLDPLEPLWQKWLTPLVEKSPDHRPQSAQAALESLDTLFSQHPVYSDHSSLEDDALTATWEPLDGETEVFRPLHARDRFRGVDIDYAVLEESRQKTLPRPPTNLARKPPQNRPPKVMEVPANSRRLDTILTFIIVALLSFLILGALLWWLPI